jgi:hypothetical protein
LVAEATSKAEGLEAWICIISDIPELVAINPLDYRALCGVNNKPRAAEMIDNDSIFNAILDHVAWNVGAISVNVPHNDSRHQQIILLSLFNLRKAKGEILCDEILATDSRSFYVLELKLNPG